MSLTFYAKYASKKKSISIRNKQSPKKLQRLNIFVSFMGIIEIIALYAFKYFL